MLDKINLDYKFKYLKNLHEYSNSGSYFDKDNNNNLVFILYSALVKDSKLLKGKLNLNLKDFDCENINIELDYNKESKNYKYVNYTKSNSVNSLNTINNKKENDEEINLIIKYKNFELGYQLSGNNYYFIGYNIINLIKKRDFSFNFNSRFYSNGDKLLKIYGSSYENLNYDFSYYLGKYDINDSSSLRSKFDIDYKINYNNFVDYGLNLNYLSFKNNSINSVNYINGFLEIE